MAVKSLATAFVNIVPGTQDFEATVKRDINAKMEGAGGEAADGFGKGFGKLSSIISTAVVAAGVIAVGEFIKSGVESANALAGQLHEVVSLTGLTGTEADKAFSGFQDGVKKLSTDLGVAQETLTSGLYQALSAGVPTDNAFTFMEVAAKAAIAGVTSTETAVDGLSTIINAFGMQASDAGAVADSMFTAVKGGKTTFEELSASLFNIAPAAAASKVSMQEVNAAIATLTASGVPTTVATTQLRAALTGLQRPSEDLDKIFQALGYANAQAAIEAKGMTFALDAVKDASGGSNGKLQTLLGSVEAVAAANVLAGTGAEKMNTELERQASAAGATNAAFAEIDKGRALERLNNSMAVINTTVGQIFLPAVSAVADFLSTTLSAAFNWATENMNLAVPAFILIGGVMLAALLPALITVTTAVWSFTVALLANPITWIVIGIVALIAAIVLLWMNWDTVVKWISDVWNGFIGWITDYMTAFAGWWGEVWDGIVNFFTDLWNGLVDWIVGLILGYFNFWRGIWDSIIGFFTGVWNAVATWWNDFWNGIIDFVVGLIVGYVSFWRDVWTNIFNFLKDVGKNISNWWDGFWNGLIDFFKGVFSGISDFVGGIFKGVANAIIDVINWVIGGINGFIDVINVALVGVNALTGSNLKMSKLGKLPHLAKGGLVTSPTTAVIGEAGPEVVTPLKDFERMMGLTDSGNGNTVNYYAAPNTSLDSEQALFNAMRRAKVVAGW